MTKVNIFPKNEEAIPAEFLPSPIIQKSYLKGNIIEHHEGAFQDVYSPISINGKPVFLGKYPLISADESLEVLKVAEKAWNKGRGEWAKASVKERCRVIRLFVKKMQERRHQMITMIMWEICKNLDDATAEFDRTIQYCLDSVERLEKENQSWEAWKKVEGIWVQITRNPRGIVLCMGPSNYPLNETFTTLIPALLMGNVVIFKPAKWGVLLLEPLMECFEECFPTGVITTLYGNGPDIIPPIARTGRIDIIAFIGGTGTADRILKECPLPHKEKEVLGLGAKNPGIILEHTDIDKIIAACVKGALGYNGQRCTALKIFFVQKSRSKEFREKFVAAVNNLKPGMPWEKGTQLTPILPETMGWMTSLRDDALLHGAEIINEEGGVVNEGYMHPAVLFPVNSKMKIYRAEQFGPLVPIVEFEDIKEVLDWIHTSEYGQQISVFGSKEDLKEILIFKEETKNQQCRMNINTLCQRGPDEIPFTGRRDSAMGTLDILNALLEFSIEEVIAIPENEANKELLSDFLVPQTTIK